MAQHSDSIPPGPDGPSTGPLTGPSTGKRDALVQGRLGLYRREVNGAYRGTRVADFQSDAVPSVVVVGGGLGGIAAAIALRERGAKVTLVEQKESLGGRLASSLDLPAPVFPVFKHFYNIRSLLSRIDPNLSSLTSIGAPVSVNVLGVQNDLAKLTRTVPVNLLSYLRQSRFLRLSDYRQIDTSMLRSLVAFDPLRRSTIPQEQTAAEFLDQLGLPLDARGEVFRTLSNITTARENDLSAIEFLSLLHFQFLGNPEGLSIEMTKESPADAIFRPFERLLNQMGVTLCLGKSAKAIEWNGPWEPVTVSLADTQITASSAVLALPARALVSFVKGSPSLNQSETFVRQISNLRSQGVSTLVRLELDKSPLPDRAKFMSIVDHPMFNTAVRLDQIEGAYHRETLRHGGSVIQLQGVATRGTDPALQQKDALVLIGHLWPELRGANVRRSSHTEVETMPSCSHAGETDRPRIMTPYGNITVSGDFVHLPFPSGHIERSVASGFLAANALLDRVDVVGEAVFSIPPRSFLTAIRNAIGV